MMGSSSKLLIFVLLQALIVCIAHGKNVHHYNFVLEEANFTRMCSTKSMLTVNGSFPGPVIRAQKGDTVFVNVRNQGNYGVTIHWHGVKQPRNPWSDGPENITQCPIKPGTNFTYEVILSTEEGTLWWHAHSDWSRATVHGAFVILPASRTTYPFPTPYAEQILFLGSWFKGDMKKIIENIPIGGDPPISDGYTMNGQPGDLYQCSRESTFQMLVDSGKTYLLRIINGVMNEEQFFGIANHTLTVVAQDGAYIKPINTSYIMITPGQTMDVLVTANQAPSLYYIASSAYSDSLAPFDTSTTTAIFRYSGNYTTPMSPFFPTLPAYTDTAAATNFTTKIRALASPSHPVNVPRNVTKRLYITIAINSLPCDVANGTCLGESNTRRAASLTNVTFVTPSIDILQAYYRNLSGVFTRDFPDEPPYYYNFTGDVGTNTLISSTGTKANIINYGEVVEIVFQGTNVGASMNHPMHLHGFSFYLVGTGFGNFNNVTDPMTYNLVDPPEVNTIGVNKNGWAAIRFVADNPGVWFMHCHLEKHSSWGMDTVIIVRDGSTKATSMLPPPVSMPTCS